MIADYPLKAGKNTDTLLTPTKIVLHAIAEWVKISQEYKGIPAGEYYAPHWLSLIGFCYHKIFTPSGVTIRCRPDNRVAYHARAGGHNFSALGGCFMVPGVHDYGSFLNAMKQNYLTEAATDAGIKTVRLWMIQNHIDRQSIVTHASIDPDNKKDPGEGFPLVRFMEAL